MAECIEIEDDTTEDRLGKKITSDFKKDRGLKYLYKYKEDSSTRNLVHRALKLPCDGDKWDSKYKLPELEEVQEFAENIYSNYKKKTASEIALKFPWKLLYRVQGRMLNSSQANGFYGELYFNTDNHYLLLAIKGTTLLGACMLGDVCADIKNVLFNMKGGALNSAITFGEKVRQLMLKFERKPMLIITGHSLGGYLAQIITFTIIYFIEGEDRSFLSRESPSDDFGIYTKVFDSPAALQQMISIDPRNPLDMRRFDLPITNFVKDSNKINTWSGKHSGQVVAITGFENKDLGTWERLRTFNFMPSHSISNFKQINAKQSKLVVYLEKKKTAPYNTKKISSIYFSPKHFKLLDKFSILGSICAELLEKLPKFKLSHACLTLTDKETSAEEFIPRAQRFFSQYKDELESGKFNGKQIFNMVVYNLWRAEMLEDAHELRLNEEWKQRIEQWQDGTKIGGFKSHEEMRFFGCLLHNTILSYFHYDYHKFLTIADDQVRSFATDNKATLVLIVKEENRAIQHKKQNELNIVYLVLDSGTDVKMDNLVHSDLHDDSKEKFKNTELDFMGHKVTSKEIIGEKLFENLQIWSIYSMKVESAMTDELFYCDQSIESEDEKCKFKSATEFALEFSRRKLKFVLISSEAGMGKSTALKQIAKTLQNQLHQNYWIVHLNLFSLQKELHEEKRKLNTLAAAIEFVRNAVLGKRKEDEVLKKVFDWKVEAKEMVLLFDSLDEICPTHKETADILIKHLRETELQIVVTTRPHEGKNFKDAEIFKIAPISSLKMKEKYIRQKCQMMGKIIPLDFESWLDKIHGACYDYIFWSFPLTLNIAIDIFDLAENLEAVSDKIHFFKTFLEKSISNTLEIKIKLDKSLASGCYSEKQYLYNELIQILAICTLFHTGKISQEFVQKIKDNRNFINRFDMASVEDYNKVAFLHSSLADHIVAELFVQNLQQTSRNKILLDNMQLKSIIFDKKFSYMREHICKILARKPIKLLTYVSSFIEKRSVKSLLSILIEEDRYELYLLLKRHLNSQLNKTIIVHMENEDVELYPLYFALLKARQVFAQQLLHDGAQFEAILSEKYVLHLAIEKGFYKEAMNHFESLKSNINEIRFDFPQTPLQIAAKNESREMVEFLIEKGAEVNYEDGDTHSPLYYAIEANSAEIVELLIANKANSAQALNWAALLNRKEIFDIIYEKYTLGELKVERLRQSLFNAVYNGHLEMVKHIYNFLKASLTEFKEFDKKLLHIAASRGHFNCIKYIFKHQQLSVNDFTNETGLTLLMIACWNGNIEIANWLLAKTADVNAVDDEGKSCFHFAVQSGNKNIVEILVTARAEINVKDKKGWTPLFYAFGEENKEKREDLVDYLVQNSADVNLRDNKGNTCFHYK